MSNNLTQRINDANISSIRHQIALKKSNIPHFGTSNQVSSIITDMDHFPYTRYFRGVHNSAEPVVFEREAGWRPTHDPCYKGSCDKSEENPSYPSHCFEAACSTVYPCYPKYLQKISDRDAINVQLNKACIVQYR